MPVTARSGDSWEAVVRRPGDAPVTAWDDPVRGRLRFRTLLDSADTPTAALSTGLAELDADGWLGLHRHPQPEVYHVVEGDGLVSVGDAVHEVGPGACVFIPGGAPHGIRNAGGRPLRLLYTFPTDSLADISYEWLEEPPGP